MNIYVSYLIVKFFVYGNPIPYTPWKGQKLIAQGNALFFLGGNLSPCKGKSFKTPGNI